MYWVIIVDAQGCTARDSTEIVVALNVVIPNAFTPDGDGLNDFFGISNPYIEVLELRVFNRWGETLYLSSTPVPGWDGTYQGVPQEMGTYLYNYRAVTRDGRPIEGSGSVNLLR
jgi:gliding motility-associated-like protein